MDELRAEVIVVGIFMVWVPGVVQDELKSRRFEHIDNLGASKHITRCFCSIEVILLVGRVYAYCKIVEASCCCLIALKSYSISSTSADDEIIHASSSHDRV